MNPIDAYEWLLNEFQAYAHNRRTWVDEVDVREVIRQARELLNHYKSEQKE